MKKKDLLDLKNKSINELAEKAQEISKSIVDTSLELKLGKVNNVHLANAKRKELAQIMTLYKIKSQSEAQTSMTNKSKGSKN